VAVKRPPSESLSVRERNPEVVALAKQLRRRCPKGGQRSLREVAAELARLGHFNQRGNVFSSSAIVSMCIAPSLSASFTIAT
jgi:hypothetical protein